MANNVLVLDDDPTSREALVRTLKATDFNTVAPSGPFRTIDELKHFAGAKGITHLVTDHRLREKTFSSFLGATAAASLSLMKIAPVLVTAFASQDMDHDIRPHLGSIPCIIKRNSNPVDPQAIRGALETSALEIIDGKIPRSRRTSRSIVSVEHVIQRRPSGPRELQLLIRQWRKDMTVGFPASSLNPTIQAALKPGLLLIAQVNIEAEAPDKLFLRDFELPNSEDMYDL